MGLVGWVSDLGSETDPLSVLSEIIIPKTSPHNGNNCNKSKDVTWNDSLN